MTAPVIVVEGLSKCYRIGRRERYRTLREALVEAVASPVARLRGTVSRQSRGAEERAIWALRDVAFDVAPGEVVGIIGRNGAGKSTLLKVLSRITEPTAGRARVQGRVGSLLEVGTGFHPELTGRENVYLSGAILGMRRAEIQRTFDSILAFAGTERFVDTPIKHYSSGMYTRLAFSVAVHLPAEVLLVDEVLAVGDAAFQLKCLNKMAEVSDSGRTILFVSHNMEAVAKLCRRCVLLEEGRVSRIGSPQACIDHYLLRARDREAGAGAEIALTEHPGRVKHHDGPVRLTNLSIRGAAGDPPWTAPCGRPLEVILGYRLVEGAAPQDVSFTITVSSSYNHRITSCRSHDTYLDPIRVQGAGTVRCRIARLPLVHGVYWLTVACSTEAGFSDGVYDAASFEVTGSDFYPSGLVPPRTQGEALLDHTWRVQSEDGDVEPAR